MHTVQTVCPHGHRLLTILAFEGVDETGAGRHPAASVDRAPEVVRDDCSGEAAFALR